MGRRIEGRKYQSCTSLWEMLGNVIVVNQVHGRDMPKVPYAVANLAIHLLAKCLRIQKTVVAVQ